jgi:hypothetical protein
VVWGEEILILLKIWIPVWSYSWMLYNTVLGLSGLLDRKRRGGIFLMVGINQMDREGSISRYSEGFGTDERCIPQFN